MLCVGVKHVNIAKYYGIKKCTDTNIIRRIRNKSKTILKKKERKKNYRKFSFVYYNVTFYKDVLIPCFLSSNVSIKLRAGQRLCKQVMFPTFKSGYQTLSVWGEFSVHGRTPSVRSIGSFDRHAYLVMIDNHILPFVYDIHCCIESFVLLEGNCGPHRAKSIAMYLANE